MRRAAAAALLAWALAAHAQTPPDTAPPPPEPVPAAAPASESAAPAESVAPVTTPTGHAPPSKAAAAPKAAPKAPAAAPPDDREAEVAALHLEVGRLQSALDAERAAAAPPPEETAPVLQPATGLWGWLALAAVLGLAAGFALGWWVLDRRMRARFGGLRIF
jgi:hypothetical protein